MNAIMIQSIFFSTGGCGIYSLGTDFISWSFVNDKETERAVAPERVLERVSCGCRVACSKRGGGITNVDDIVQRCALFVLAKHVETVTARMIETQ